eukprot:g54784.t1
MNTCNQLRVEYRWPQQTTTTAIETNTLDHFRTLMVERRGQQTQCPFHLGHFCETTTTTTTTEKKKPIPETTNSTLYETRSSSHLGLLCCAGVYFNEKSRILAIF